MGYARFLSIAAILLATFAVVVFLVVAVFWLFIFYIEL